MFPPTSVASRRRHCNLNSWGSPLPAVMRVRLGEDSRLGCLVAWPSRLRWKTWRRSHARTLDLRTGETSNAIKISENRTADGHRWTQIYKKSHLSEHFLGRRGEQSADTRGCQRTNRRIGSRRRHRDPTGIGVQPLFAGCQVRAVPRQAQVGIHKGGPDVGGDLKRPIALRAGRRWGDNGRGRYRRAGDGERCRC